MSDEPNHVNSNGHGDYERSDIGVTGIVYFLIVLAVACGLVFIVVKGMYWFLERRSEAEQAPVSPLVTNAPADTRRVPPQYKTDAEGKDYEKYLEKGFPAPQLETDERNQLNKIRLREEEALSTYDWVDKTAGTVRIPIDRAMELVAQRGLPTRSQSNAAASAAQPEKTAAQPEKKKAKK